MLAVRVLELPGAVDDVRRETSRGNVTRALTMCETSPEKRPAIGTAETSLRHH